MKFKNLECKYDECKEIFIPRREWQKFCSSKCRKKHWLKKHGMIDFQRKLRELEAENKEIKEKLGMNE